MCVGLLSRRTGLAVCAAGALAAACVIIGPAIAASSLQLYSAIQVGTSPLTSWDILWVDQATGILTMSDASHNTVNVVNTRANPPALILQTANVFTGAVGAFNPACGPPWIGPTCAAYHNGPNGSLIVNHREIWAGDGDSSAKVLSLSTGQLLYTIPTGGYNRADELCVSPPIGNFREGLVVIANDAESPQTQALGGRFASPFITFIDVASYTVVAQLPFNGQNGTPNATDGLEQCQWNPHTGTFWISVPEDNGPGDGSGVPAVAEISATTQSVIHKYDLGGACTGNGATGLTIGPAPQMFVGGCGAIVDDGSTGGVKGSFVVIPNETGADEVYFNQTLNIYYQGISGPPGVIGIVEALTKTADPSFPGGQKGSHSLAVDWTTNRVFYPVQSTVASPSNTLCTTVPINPLTSNTPGCIIVLVPGTGAGTVATSSHDFNADVKSDVAWRDTAGDVAIWLMEGSQPPQTASLGNIPTNWAIIGTGDFNGDGYSDLLWRDAGGNLDLWFLTGTQVTSTAALGNLSANWNVFGTADLNGDGKGDLLWRDSNTGTVVVWFMNGGQIASTASLGAVPGNWGIVGNDNNGNVFWRDTAGDLTVWQVQGSRVANSASLGNVPTNWRVAGIGDFNGDGISDILWQDTASGTVAIWFLNSSLSVQSTANLGQVANNWSIAQVGDYNGDRMCDILWLDSTGNVSVWFMDGGQVASTANFGNVGANWSVQSANAE